MSLMSEKEFQYHLDEFMSYLRRMEEGLSKNWDITVDFQNEFKKKANEIINQLSTNERLSDFKAVTEGIKKTVEMALRELQVGTESLVKQRKDFLNTLQIFTSQQNRFIVDVRNLLQQFELVNPETIAMKGALRAIDYVKEMKESYEYLKQVREAISQKDLPDFGFFPKGIDPTVWALDIDEIEWSIRTLNVLKGIGIKTVGQLATTKESDLFKVKNLGRKSLNEIKCKLADMGLALGMEV